MEKSIFKRNVSIHTYLSLNNFAVQQKLTHCKSTILQLKNIDKEYLIHWRRLCFIAFGFVSLRVGLKSELLLLLLSRFSCIQLCATP